MTLKNITKQVLTWSPGNENVVIQPGETVQVAKQVGENILLNWGTQLVEVVEEQIDQVEAKLKEEQKVNAEELKQSVEEDIKSEDLKQSAEEEVKSEPTE